MANILIVDDELPVQQLIKEILEVPHGRCTAALNAAEARKLLKKQRFDLIISDIDIPGESGLDFSRFVLARYTDTAVIIMTGLDDAGLVKSALDIGAYGYVSKPIDKNTLLFCVDNVLQRARLEQENRKYSENLESLVEEKTTKLHENEQQYRELVQSANSIIIRLDTQGRVKFINEFAQNFFGYTEDEILNQSIVGTILPAESTSGSDLEKMFQEIVKNPDQYKNNENENMRKNGDRVWIAWTNKVIHDDAGNGLEILCIGNDVTDQRLTEKAIKESEEKLRAISESAQEAIIIMNAEGVISFWNAAAEKIFGYTIQEALNRDLHALIVPERYLKDFQKGFSNFKISGKGSAVGKMLEVTARRKDGSEFPVELSISAMKINDQYNALGIIRDISERKILEAQLLQAQKLESIGQLAAGIAHEINTPIQYVGYNAQFFKEQFEHLDPLFDQHQELLQAARAGKVPDDLLIRAESALEALDLPFIREEIPPALDQTIEGVEHVSKIVRAMKEFSHPGTDDKAQIDLNQAIESTVVVARNEWKYVAEVTTELDPDLPLVPCLPADLNQVILNMIVNAAHAIGEVVDQGSEKGTISISTRRQNGWAEIRIKDTGTGIAEKHRSRIFDPFFTTKEVGKGTGQGLAISHSIIADKHSGTLNFETETGKGTTFVIRLPIEPEAN